MPFSKVSMGIGVTQIYWTIMRLSFNGITLLNMKHSLILTSR